MSARKLHPVVIEWLAVELLVALLRRAWARGLNHFEALVDATDCYPCRVCWETGDFPRFWIETGPRQDECDYAEEYEL